jgi:hypothetical protein
MCGSADLWERTHEVDCCQLSWNDECRAGFIAVVTKFSDIQPVTDSKKAMVQLRRSVTDWGKPSGVSEWVGDLKMGVTKSMAELVETEAKTIIRQIFSCCPFAAYIHNWLSDMAAWRRADLERRIPTTPCPMLAVGEAACASALAAARQSAAPMTERAYELAWEQLVLVQALVARWTNVAPKDAICAIEDIYESNRKGAKPWFSPEIGEAASSIPPRPGRKIGKSQKLQYARQIVADRIQLLTYQLMAADAYPAAGGLPLYNPDTQDGDDKETSDAKTKTRNSGKPDADDDDDGDDDGDDGDDGGGDGEDEEPDKPVPKRDRVSVAATDSTEDDDDETRSPAADLKGGRKPKVSRPRQKKRRRTGKRDSKQPISDHESDVDYEAGDNEDGSDSGSGESSSDDDKDDSLDDKGVDRAAEKQVKQDDAQLAGITTKKKRKGRPKSSPATSKKTQANNNPPTEKKRRGRPPKTAQLSSGKDGEKNPPPTSAKPRKNVRPGDAPASATSATAPVAVQTHPATAQHTTAPPPPNPSVTAVTTPLRASVPVQHSSVLTTAAPALALNSAPFSSAQAPPSQTHAPLHAPLLASLAAAPIQPPSLSAPAAPTPFGRQASPRLASASVPPSRSPLKPSLAPASASGFHQAVAHNLFGAPPPPPPSAATHNFLAAPNPLLSRAGISPLSALYPQPHAAPGLIATPPSDPAVLSSAVVPSAAPILSSAVALAGLASVPTAAVPQTAQPAASQRMAAALNEMSAEDLADLAAYLDQRRKAAAAVADAAAAKNATNQQTQKSPNLRSTAVAAPVIANASAATNSLAVNPSSVAAPSTSHATPSAATAPTAATNLSVPPSISHAASTAATNLTVAPQISHAVSTAATHLSVAPPTTHAVPHPTNLSAAPAAAASNLGLTASTNATVASAPASTTPNAATLPGVGLAVATAPAPPQPAPHPTRASAPMTATSQPYSFNPVPPAAAHATQQYPPQQWHATAHVYNTHMSQYNMSGPHVPVRRGAAAAPFGTLSSTQSPYPAAASAGSHPYGHSAQQYALSVAQSAAPQPYAQSVSGYASQPYSQYSAPSYATSTPDTASSPAYGFGYAYPYQMSSSNSNYQQTASSAPQSAGAVYLTGHMRSNATMAPIPPPPAIPTAYDPPASSAETVSAPPPPPPPPQQTAVISSPRTQAAVHGAQNVSNAIAAAVGSPVTQPPSSLP